MSHILHPEAAAFDLAAFMHALEHSDAGALLTLYDEDAEMETIDRNRPPSAPLRLVDRPPSRPSGATSARGR